MADEILLAVDWSGALRGVRRALWVAEAQGGRLARLECGRDRRETIELIVGLAAREPRLVVGFDFAFSFPAWFLRERALASAREAWELVRREGEDWLARCDPPFWGRPGSPRPLLESGRSPYRRTEGERLPLRGIGPKSVFQIGGAGAVGTGSLRGMPWLLELSRAGFSIWPFDPPRLPMALEIYPRWLTGRTRKSSELSRRLFLARWADGEDRKLLERAATSEHAFDAAASAHAMARYRNGFTRLGCNHDPEILLEGRIWSPNARM